MRGSGNSRYGVSFLFFSFLFFALLSSLMDSVQCIAGVIVNIPIPISFAFSWAASEAILAASRERVGRLFVADMIVIIVVLCDIFER